MRGFLFAFLALSPAIAKKSVHIELSDYQDEEHLARTLKAISKVAEDEGMVAAWGDADEPFRFGKDVQTSIGQYVEPTEIDMSSDIYEFLYSLSGKGQWDLSKVFDGNYGTNDWKHTLLDPWHLTQPVGDQIVPGVTSEVTLGGKKHNITVLSLRPLAFEVLDVVSADEANLLVEQTGADLADKPFKFDVPVLPSLTEEAVKDFIGKTDSPNTMTINSVGTLLSWLAQGLLKADAVDALADVLWSAVASKGQESLPVDTVAAHLAKVQTAAKLQDMLKDPSNLVSAKLSKALQDKDSHLVSLITERLANLLNFTQVLMKGAEPLELSLTHPDGHVQPHYESGSMAGGDCSVEVAFPSFQSMLNTMLDRTTQCCSARRGKGEEESGCSRCRYATAYLYLNQDFQGGEVTLPIADNSTLYFSKPQELGCRHTSCSQSNVVTKAVTGKAVVVFNHLLHQDKRWSAEEPRVLAGFRDRVVNMGDMDVYSQISECPVTKGQKWMAKLNLGAIKIFDKGGEDEPSNMQTEEEEEEPEGTVNVLNDPDWESRVVLTEEEENEGERDKSGSYASDSAASPKQSEKVAVSKPKTDVKVDKGQQEVDKNKINMEEMDIFGEPKREL
mmetsp:Transcript_21280/g.42241  ORF Transcript_21280/g.42241 Transcript_21280/m.42241 type:complete len:616 (+) Transcript_21280:32-1879(+)